MKVFTVVGARPQFIKAAVVSRELRKTHTEILVHTGQHYDYNMSDIFFRELDIPKPDYNLGISGGTLGKMTGEMLIHIEEVLMKEKPDVVLLYGDTNSTLAGALAAVKLHIPIAHVEAGNRLGTKNNPEEINRIVTDHVSSLHLCCTESAKEFLRKEGITDTVYVVGDPMYDAFLYYSAKVGNDIPEKLTDLNGQGIDLPEHFYYMTCHREENAGTDKTLTEILEAMKPFPSNAFIYRDGKLMVQRVDAMTKKSSVTSQKPIVKIKEDAELYEVDNAKIMFRMSSEQTLKVEEYFEKHPHPHYKAFKTQSTLIEFAHRNISKAYALEKICEHRDYSLENVWSFGDTTNDNAMLQVSGRGICMLNGTEDTKAIADAITEFDNNQDGVAIYIENEFLRSGSV